MIFLAGVPRGDGPRPFLAVEHVRDLLLELVVEGEEQDWVDQARDCSRIEASRPTRRVPLVGEVDAQRPPTEEEGGGQDGQSLCHSFLDGRGLTSSLPHVEQDERVDDDDDQGGDAEDKEC